MCNLKKESPFLNKGEYLTKTKEERRKEVEEIKDTVYSLNIYQYKRRISE